MSTTTQSPRRMTARRTVNRHFVRHYAQMVVVMFLGMAVLGVPAGWALEAFGSSWAALQTDAPAAMLALMGLSMTAPMVGWMARLGHSRRAVAEMALAMIVPTAAVIVLLAAGGVTDIGVLLAVEHVAMLLGMFVVMLARPEEYSGPARHRGGAVAV